MWYSDSVKQNSAQYPSSSKPMQLSQPEQPIGMDPFLLKQI
jgi:hypothetical protein